MKPKYILLIAILISVFLISIWIGNANIYLIILINLLILLFLILKNYNWGLIIVLIFHWLLYFLVLLFHKYINVLPGSGNDDIRFEQLSLGYYYHIAFGTEINVFQSSTAYSKLLAFFYYLGSPHELLPGILNITIHTIVLILLYKICILVFKNKKVGLLSIILFTIYPLTLVNTVISLREIYIILFILLFTFSILKYHQKRNWLYILLSILSICCGSIFHVGIIGLILFLAVYFLIFSKQQFSFKILIFILLIILFFAFIITTENTKVQSILNDDDKTISEQNITPTSRADYIMPGESDGIVKNIKQELFFVLKPLPWEIRTISDVVGLTNLLFIWISIFLGIKLYVKSKNENILIILLIVVISYFVFALGTYNYGSALRHRDKSSMLLFMFICQYYAVYKKGDDNNHLQYTKKK